MIAKRFVPSALDGAYAYVDTTPVVAFTAEFDKSSNKLFERHLHAENRSHLHQPTPVGAAALPGAGVDSINRLLQYQRGTLASGGGSVTTPITLPGTDSFRGYELDHLGNWKRTTYAANPPTPPAGASSSSSSSTSGGGGSSSSSSSSSGSAFHPEDTEVRQHNLLNQITRITADGATTQFAYDANGNMLDDGTRLMTYDAFNRLLRVDRKSDAATIGQYTYDADPGGGRRIRKIITNGGLSGTITNGTTDYLYAPGNQQCIEERNASDDPAKHYVWGIYIDELLQQRDDPSGLAAGPDDYYALPDLLYRNTALTDSSPTIVEAYDTDAYGNTLIFDAAGSGGDWWADDADITDQPSCAFIFTGRRYEAETRLYFVRRRYYSPSLGGFIGRDPIGFEDGMNLYWAHFVPSGTDPMGLALGFGPIPYLSSRQLAAVRSFFRQVVQLAQSPLADDITTCACFLLGVVDMSPGPG